MILKNLKAYQDDRCRMSDADFPWLLDDAATQRVTVEWGETDYWSASPWNLPV